MERLENELLTQSAEDISGATVPDGDNQGEAECEAEVEYSKDSSEENIASDTNDASESASFHGEGKEGSENDEGIEGGGENQAENPEDSIDYAALAKEDLHTLREEFPEIRGIDSIARLPNALRYGELRDMGLSPREAYLATGRISPKTDNRSHLHSSVPRGAGGGSSAMSYSELCQARELFSTLSDADIQKLYKKVKV